MPNTRKPWFQRRHYEFLVNWAATNIKPTQIVTLADVLCVDNPRFDRKKFLKTYVELRRFVRRHEEASNWVASRDYAGYMMPSPGMTEADQIRLNEAADIIVEADLRRHAFGLVVNMDAHIRAHAEANKNRGMWEYTKCWKCDSGRHPDKCPVKCQGACEYPSAVND